MARIVAGICSWADRSLIASGFYPRGASTPAARLAHVASRFPIVEADTTYYALPDQTAAYRWIAGTPSGFTFGVKSFALFTFHRTKYSSLPQWLREELGPMMPDALVSRADVRHESRVRLFEQFAAPIRTLHDAGRLSYLLFQFAPSFRYSRESLLYLRSVRELCARLPLAVEVRSATWFARDALPRFLNELERLNIAYTAADEPKEGGVPREWPVTAEWGSVARFHGRNSRAWRDPRAPVRERFDWEYTREELEPWSRAAERAAASFGPEARICLMFNNCVGDKAVRAASMISEMLALPRADAAQAELGL